VPRAVRRAVADDPVLPRDLLLERAGAPVEAIALRPVDRPLLAAAGALDEPGLRALDAILAASALDLHPLDAFVTYDERQAAAPSRTANRGAGI
jgi:predicted nucleic acid-binding protein